MASISNLPRTRQRSHSAPAGADGHATAQESLTRAFLTFTQAAGSLEKSYTQLQAEVSRLHQELQRTNSELDRSLEENARVRTFLSHVLENLPCGVLVVSGDDQMQVINPEARRLLQISSDWRPGADNPLPASFEKLIGEFPTTGAFTEQEWVSSGFSANRYIGVLRASVSEGSGCSGDTIWILRDITEEKRLAAERENARRSTTQLSNGNSIQINLPGNQLFQNASGDAFAALQNLIASLNSGNNIGAAVSQIDNALSQVNVQRVFYGNALNQINLSESFLSQDKINLSSQENSLVAADPAKVAADFAQAQTANQATLAATGRILSLPTLLDFIK